MPKKSLFAIFRWETVHLRPIGDFTSHDAIVYRRHSIFISADVLLMPTVKLSYHCTVGSLSFRRYVKAREKKINKTDVQ